MCHNYAKRFLPLLFLFTAGVASAQSSNKENDPYTRYGIGEVTAGSNTLLRGMGYASTAYSSPTSVNADNPASYASLRLTTYEAGFTASLRNIKSDGQSFGTGSASLAYLNVGIPLGKHAGFTLGLRPQTHIYYNIIDSNISQGLGQTAVNYSGEGGLNYGFIGLAGKVKGFSLGANFGYLFGNIRNTSSLVNLDTVHAVNSDFTHYTRIGSIYWKGGAQYEARLDSSLRLHLGATVTLNQDLNASSDDYVTQFHYSGVDRLDDTVTHVSGSDGKITLPLSYSFGAQVNGLNWALAADVTSTKWGQYRNYGLADSSLADQTIRFNVGGEFTPNPLSLYSYLSRVTYRLGFYYGTDYVKLDDVSLKYYAVTAGVSLPFKRTTDRIHMAIEIGKRGTEAGNLVQENFFKFHLGISLNDKWFIKRKYD